MPDKNVAVTATWSPTGNGSIPGVATPEEDLPDPDTPLTDPDTPLTDPDTPLTAPDDDSPFIADHIQYIFGYSNGSVGPDNPITRAEMCVLLFRLLAAEDKNDSLDARFPDVKKGVWYYQGVTYLASIGIVTGYPSGQFEPDALITRAEFTAMLSRFFEFEPGSGTSFPDITSHWAKNYINYAASKDWVKGYPDGTFRPENNLTRAEAVTAINRMLNRGIDKADLPGWIPKYNDLPSTHWAYADIIEASVRHLYERKDDGKEIWMEK